MFWSARKAEKRLNELQERLEKLERDSRALALEWENSYDKLRTMMGRIAKRAEAMHEEAEENGRLHPGDAHPTPTGSGNTPHGFLTARQKQINQEIMRRRAGG